MNEHLQLPTNYPFEDKRFIYTTIMHYHRCLVTFMSTIVLLTIVHDVTGSGFGEEETTSTSTTPTGSANSMKVSWITISSISMIVIGLINGHLRRFIF
ncbi:unnamed protein product [Schistosoma guineensis]|nr:unnamed protein product [Schistosoma guineensis]